MEDGVHLYLWIEGAVITAIILAFAVQAFILFRPEHLSHHPARARIGAMVQGVVIGVLVGLFILPLRLSFFLPDIPVPKQALASTAVLPAFLLLLVIRQGILVRAPLVGRYIRAYRRAALKFQIDLARRRLQRLESMDTKQRDRDRAVQDG